MHQQNLDRLNDHLRSTGVAAALLANPFTITWLTGYAPPIQTGPSPFDGGPALGWFFDGELVLILSDMEAGAAIETGTNVREYASYTIEEPLLCYERQAAVLREVLRAHSTLRGPVAVEMQFLTAALFEPLKESLPKATLQPFDGQLNALRAIKTAEEIEKIRAALRLCDLGQTEMRAHLRPGISEMELWGQTKARLELAAGGRLPVLADLVAGPRTAEIGGLPGSYVLQPADTVLFDVVPRLDGYWGDNCATYFVGDPTPKMQRIYGVVHDALRRGVDAVRPGLRARDLDALVRGAIQDAGYEVYPHHTGHGMGVSYHEEPRIVPYNDMPLEAGMVIAIEPGIYLPDVSGVRLEDAILVTPEGCEVLTQHLAAA